MKINMADKYALADDPTKEIHILSVNGKGEYPVIYQHKADGGQWTLGDCHMDGVGFFAGNTVVPLQKKPLELWVNCYTELHAVHTSPESAASGLCPTGETIHMREVTDE